MSKNKIIQQIENEQMAKALPDFGPGDTVVVQVKIREGDRERLQAFEGVVIGVRSRALNTNFTVRKISHGVGVERTFQAFSPLIESITVKRRGDVRQARDLYLRARELCRSKDDLVSMQLFEEAGLDPEALRRPFIHWNAGRAAGKR